MCGCIISAFIAYRRMVDGIKLNGGKSARCKSKGIVQLRVAQQLALPICDHTAVYT